MILQSAVPHLNFESGVPTMYAEELRTRMQQRELRLTEFWILWQKEYIRNLPHVVSKFTAKGNIGIGSVVLIREDNLKRLKWPMARVIELHSGRDGKVRCASLKTVKGVVIRPVQRLHNLEISDCPGGAISASDAPSSAIATNSSKITNNSLAEAKVVTRPPMMENHRFTKKTMSYLFVYRVQEE
ncbi:Uncharacterised protein r2_g3624 [Pycnogonum litorale]